MILSCVILFCSCGKRDSDVITIYGQSQGTGDDNSIVLDYGWFVQPDSVVIDYKKKIITMKIKYVHKELNNDKIKEIR